MARIHTSPDEANSAWEEVIHHNVPLDVDVAERALQKMIDDVLQKPIGEMNAPLIEKCESLLWHIAQKKRPDLRLPEKPDPNRLLASLRKAEYKRRQRRRVFSRASIAIPMVFLILITGELLLAKRGFDTYDSADEQQLMVQGINVDPGLVEHGVADSSGDLQTITTSEINDLETFLGYVPQMPTWLPDGWTLKSINATKWPQRTMFSIEYSNDTNSGLLVYSYTHYEDIGRARLVLEQNAQSEKVQTPSGKDIFITKNYEATTCLWIDGLDVFTIMGVLDLSIMENIADATGG